MASVIRDIVCFTPLAIILPSVLEGAEVGTGINGILYAAPISDLVAIAVIFVLTISFFRKLNKEIVIEEQKELAS